MTADISWARSRLLKWFEKHGRSYPWREAVNAYHVLVAEIMLQRTKADQVVPVYNNFINKYPDIESLSKADLSELEHILWSLGLHGRGQVVLMMAQDLRDLFHGQVPDNRDDIKRVTGVGDYVAGAVLSVAFNLPEWIVDANVVRVFSRFFGLELKGEVRRSRQMISLAQEYSQTKKPRKANLALLDHAALICKSGVPLCLNCPIRMRCNFFSEMKIRVKNKPAT